MGSVLLARGRPVPAETALRRALADAPRQRAASLRRAIAVSLIAQGRYEQGLRTFADLLEDHPGNDLAYIRQGEALLEAGRPAAAVASFRQALPLVRDPTQEPAVHRLLGKALRRLDRPEDAARHLDRALEIGPRNVWTLLDRAEVAAQWEGADGDRGNVWLDRARESAAAALEREPGNPLAHIASGAFLLRQSEYGAARAALEQALSLSRSHAWTRQAHRVLGAVFEAQGEPAAAARHYGAALEHFALDAEALERLAAIRFQGGRNEDALYLYHRLVRLRPYDAAVRGRLAEALDRLGAHAEASAAARASADLAGPLPPRTPSSRSVRAEPANPR